MRICAKCEVLKNEDEFYQKTKDKKHCYCKKCFNLYCMQRWIDKKIKFVEEKGGQCLDCNIQYNGKNLNIFEFHHIDPAYKKYDWNKLRLRSEESIKKELAKCDLLCANCHRMRHQQ
jgi:hypothetical protein